MNLRNVHDANFATTLALGRHMGKHLPDDRRCHVVAVEIADNMTFAERLRPALEAALRRLALDAKTHILMALATWTGRAGAGGASGWRSAAAWTRLGLCP